MNIKARNHKRWMAKSRLPDLRKAVDEAKTRVVELEKLYDEAVVLASQHDEPVGELPC